MTNSTWEKAQAWELDWHNNCVNSYFEEQKQLEYAKLMGLETSPTHKTPYNFDLEGKSVLDIGGGAYSLLLKCVNFKEAVVIDPLMDKYPEWVRQRYKTHKVIALAHACEVLSIESTYDESWFYNVLGHTYNPEKVVKNALRIGKIVRVFEWLNTLPNIGHPQTLTEENMNKWLGGEGKITTSKRGNMMATSYSGIFKGDHFV